MWAGRWAGPSVGPLAAPSAAGGLRGRTSKAPRSVCRLAEQGCGERGVCAIVGVGMALDGGPGIPGHLCRTSLVNLTSLVKEHLQSLTQLSG